MKRMHVSRKAFKVARCVELRREVERAQARVDIVCITLAQLEIVLRERQVELEATWRKKEELEVTGRVPLLENDPITKGLFSSPPQ